jgi:hypothetical protein
MNAEETALPGQPFAVRLKEKEELKGMCIRFAQQDPRFDDAADLPKLVVVQSSSSGRQAIARTGWWGNLNMNPQWDAAEASTDLVRAMRRRGSGKDTTDSAKAKVRKAKRRDVAIYARGFWLPMWGVVVEALAAIAAAAFGILTATAPAWILGAALGLVAFSEILKATAGIVDKADPS